MCVVEGCYPLSRTYLDNFDHRITLFSRPYQALNEDTLVVSKLYFATLLPNLRLYRILMKGSKISRSHQWINTIQISSYSCFPTQNNNAKDVYACLRGDIQGHDLWEHVV